MFIHLPYILHGSAPRPLFHGQISNFFFFIFRGTPTSKTFTGQKKLKVGSAIQLVINYTQINIYLQSNLVITGLLDLDAGRLARSQNPEGPATGHLDTGFLGFPGS